MLDLSVELSQKTKVFRTTYKKIWSKFTHTLCKLDLFRAPGFFLNYEMVELTKRVILNLAMDKQTIAYMIKPKPSFQL
jgi:hypothetical protein